MRFKFSFNLLSFDRLKDKTLLELDFYFRLNSKMLTDKNVNKYFKTIYKQRHKFYL